MHETLANGLDQCPLISEVAEQTLIHSHLHSYVTMVTD